MGHLCELPESAVSMVPFLKRKRDMMKKIFLLFMTFVFFAALAQAESATFNGSGSAVVVGGNFLSAKNLAYEAARKKAISLAIESFIRKGSKDEANFRSRKAEILKGPMDFIQNERQVSQHRDGKLLTIVVAVAVDTQKLKTMMGQKGLLASHTKDRKQNEFPAIMVILTEELNGKKNTQPYCAGVIRAKLLEHDFDVVDEKLVEKNIAHDQAVQGVLNGNLQAAQAISLQYGAGIIVKGKVLAQESSLKSGGMQAYGANVYLEAVKADSGKVLASASADGSYPHINAITGAKKAIEDASEKAADKLVKAIESSFEQTSDSLLVSISDINFSQLAILKKIFYRDFPAVSRIKDKGFSGSVAKLDVQVEGSTSDFAEQIALKDFETFKLEVVSFSPGVIDLVLTMK